MPLTLPVPGGCVRAFDIPASWASTGNSVAASLFQNDELVVELD